MNPADVLKEMFDLLENYAPAWYTDDQRSRMLVALTGAAERYDGQPGPRFEPSPRQLPCRRQLRSYSGSRTAPGPLRNQ